MSACMMMLWWINKQQGMHKFWTVGLWLWTGWSPSIIYSDLAPSDYFLFLNLEKKHLAGKQYRIDDEVTVTSAVEDFFEDQDERFYIHYIPRESKCCNTDGRSVWRLCWKIKRIWSNSTTSISAHELFNPPSYVYIALGVDRTLRSSEHGFSQYKSIYVTRWHALNNVAQLYKQEVTTFNSTI